jgi:arylsulfatase A-like enzyme
MGRCAYPVPHDHLPSPVVDHVNDADTAQRIGFTAAESTPLFPHDPKPPAGAPNVLAIVLDDTGFGHLGCFGSDISTPHLNGLAANGAPFNRFHVTSLCSPTRASFFTGRNHHAVGMGFLADIPLAYPGYTARLPKSAATLPRVLRDAGYSTLAVGKWHLTPRWQRSAAGPFDTWPLGMGFERHYGFLQGDTNHWAPNLVCDNHYIEAPRRPEEGYHLSEDLADQAIRMLRDQQQGAPGKPFFMYFALGAMHSPHHVAPEWVEPYKGQFDRGWDVWRQETFDRQVERGTVPAGTVLTDRPAWVQGWDDLSAEERRMHARQQEVFAGFLTHTDAQIGRLLASLEASDLLRNTLVLVFSDNGASAEGGKDGSVNEHRFTAQVRESMADNLAAYDDWGGFSTYNHYSWAWAWAGNTPHKLWKRYTWLGGTRTPLIVNWPGQVAEPGAVRSQFAHVIDLMPTILAAAGLETPASVDGVDQQRVDGTSLLGTLEDARAGEVHHTQYFEMLGSRSIFDNGWKATTNHISTGVLDEEELAVGSRNFEEDRWELFNLTDDFSEAIDRAGEEPERLRELCDLWDAEAARNQVLPVSDGMLDRFTGFIPPAWPAGSSRTFLPDAGPVHDESIPLLWGGFDLSAEIDALGPETEGVVCAMGDWFGGYALYVVAGVVNFTFTRACDALQLNGDTPLAVGRQNLRVSYSFSHEGGPGHMELAVENHVVDAIAVSGMLPFALQHGGAALRLGYDTGFPVSRRYTPPATFTGVVHFVKIETPGAAVGRQADEVRSALHAD